MYNTIIFDFDYTLGESTEGIIESTNYALRKLGLPCAEKEAIKQTIGFSLEKTFNVLTNYEKTELSHEFTRLFIEKADEVMVDSTALFDHTFALLNELNSKGYKIGIVTTKLVRRIESILKKFDLQDYVNIIIGADSVKNVKPSPEGLEKAINILGAEMKNVLYVGDSEVDAEAAEKAGIDFAGVLTGTTCKESFAGYANVFIMKDLNELHTFILGK